MAITRAVHRKNDVPDDGSDLDGNDICSHPDPKPVASATLMEALAAFQTKEPSVSQQEVERRYDLLAPRERDVFFRMMSDMTVKETARELGIAPKTVEHNRRSVLAKMQAKDARDLRRMINSAC